VLTRSENEVRVELFNLNSWIHYFVQLFLPRYKQFFANACTNTAKTVLNLHAPGGPKLDALKVYSPSSMWHVSVLVFCNSKYIELLLAVPPKWYCRHDVPIRSDDNHVQSVSCTEILRVTCPCCDPTPTLCYQVHQSSEAQVSARKWSCRGRCGYSWWRHDADTAKILGRVR